MGGGANSELNPNEDSTQENPYATEYYTDADKAYGVTSIALPATVEKIDPAFFQLFPNAQTIDVAEDNPSYKSYNGMLLNADLTSLLLVPEGMEGAAVLPDSMATVPACIFSRCTKLSAIEVPTGSTANAHFASENGILYTADKQTLLAAPAGLGASATIAPECTHIAEGAFWGNINLQTIVSNGNIEDIFVGQNQNATGTQKDANEESANAASSNAASNGATAVPAFNPETISSVTVVTENRAAWEKAGFTNFAEPAKPGDTAEADGFTFALLPDYTLSVSWAGETPAPEALAIPAVGTIGGAQYAVSTIGQETFKAQPIHSLDIPDGISTIETQAFAECANLESVTLAGSITSIGASAFANCTALANTELGKGLRTLNEQVFENTAIARIVLPASVQKIGARALASNANLKQVIATSDIPSVDKTALADCAGVEIYTPYKQDETYTWSAGVPATGNHLLPYGISLAQEPLTLNQGETASLLDGGYIEAAGSVEVEFAYNATSISVDTESGTVSAKQTGKTTVTANLKIEDITLASASRPVVVAVAAQPAEDSEEDTHNGEDGEEDEDNGNSINYNNRIDNPSVSYKDQLFEEGDYYTSGVFESTEKVLNRTVSLTDMAAEISPMSLEVPSVSSWGPLSKGTATKGATSQYDSTTQTLTITMTGDYQLTRKLANTYDNKTNNDTGATDSWTKWKANYNNALAVRHLVLNDYNSKNPQNEFAWLVNLESIEINGSFDLGNGSSVDASNMFRSCYSLRVIPAEFKLPSTLSDNCGAAGSHNIFSFDDRDRGSGAITDLVARLDSSNQLVDGKLLTTYAGTDSNVIAALDASYSATVDGYTVVNNRKRVSSYYTVTFDNQGGTGGHKTAGELPGGVVAGGTSASTYTIKVPNGSPIPELIGTPTYSGWTFGGYVDNLNNAPKEYVGPDGYPGFTASSKSWIKVTSNMTLKALWYKRASFNGNGGTIQDSESYYVNLPKGYPVAHPSNFDSLNLSGSKQFWEVHKTIEMNVGGVAPKYTAPSASHSGGRSFKGYTLGSSSDAYATAYYDASCNGTSAVYNSPSDFYAIWSYYTISFYSNVKLDWSWNDVYRSSSNSGVTYGNSGTGTSNANYGSAFQIHDAYSYTRWNSGFFNIRNSSSAYPVTKPGDPNNYAINYRDVSWKAPAYHTLKSIHLGSATGTVIDPTNNFYDYQTLSSNVSIYLIFADETPNDTITFNANGGYFDGNTSLTTKSQTILRGTSPTVPANPTRATTAEYTYTFKGWGTSSNATTTVTPGKANGNTTYYAVWTATKRSYTITWQLDGTGAYWGTNKNDTANKTTNVSYGSTPTAPSTPSRESTAEYSYTFAGWTPTISPVSGAATYKTTWNATKRSYDVKWKLDGAGAYWGNNTNDTADKTTSVTYGNTATAPGTPNRASTAEWSYKFKGWTPTPGKVTGAGLEYTAQWEATKRSYTITWNTNGGKWSDGSTANKTTTVEYGTKVSGFNGSTVPSRDHYTFLGWSTTTSGGTSTVKEITVKESRTYYAIWGAPYGFTIDPNGGELKASDIGLTGKSSQYLWTNNFLVTDNSLKFNVRKADGSYTNLATLNGSNVSRPGYSFVRWDWSNKNSLNNSNVGVEPGATYKAYWSEQNVTVTYKVGTAGGGSVSRTSETVAAQNGTLQGSIPKHSAGWHFVGWNTKADGSGQTLSTDATKAFVPAKQAVSGWNYSLNVSATYYAIFAPNDYTIELKKNDGTDGFGATVGTVAAKYDTPWTIRAGNVPDRRGYYFIGWDTNPNYTGTSPQFPMSSNSSGAFTDTQFTYNLTKAEDANGNAVPTIVTLYAIWTESRYTIVFHENWNEGEQVSGNAPANLNPLYSEKVTIPGQQNMSRQGYHFTGWNTRADGSGVDYKTGWVRQFVGHTDFTDAQVRDCTVNLYAQWQANTYFVFFEPNTTEEWDDQGFDTVLAPTWGETVTIETEFTRPGYEFIGWSFERNVASDESSTPIVDFHVGDTFTNLTDARNGVVRLYAQWKGAPYQIIFDGNADSEHKVETGADGPMSPLDMFLGVGRNLPKNTYTCPGFAFKGWNTKPDGTGESYLDRALVQDVPGVKDGKVTLYAQWSPVINMTSPINAHIEVYIDGMDVRVTAVKPGSPQEAIESTTRGKLFVEEMVLEPNLDPDTGMARIFPVDGTPTKDSWEDFTLEFTALNESSGKQVKSSVDFGNGFAFLPGQRNNYFVPAYNTATNTPGRLQYKLNMTVPDDAAVRYSEDPVQVGTLVFTCALAE